MSYITTIQHASFNYSKGSKIGKVAETICDRITINENVIQTAQEEVAVIKAEAIAAIKAGTASVVEIADGLKQAGFSAQRVSDLLIRYGINRNAKKAQSKASKAVQALADKYKAFAVENANTPEQAMQALRRAADDLRKELAKKAAK